MKKAWLSPLRIPEAEEGHYSIRHKIIPAGEPVPLATMRNMLLGGQKARSNNVVYDTSTRWHELHGPTGTWMTDLPIEQRQMEHCLKGVKGRVLVGGLGLGLAATMLRERKTVTHVDVVEISPEVNKLVGKHFVPGWTKNGDKVKIIVQDLFQYLKDYTGPPYDYAFYDIWQSDGEHTFFYTVVPLHTLSTGRVRRSPICWNEDVMRGQLYNDLNNRILFYQNKMDLPKPKRKDGTFIESWEYEDTEQPWWNWRVPFFRWFHEAKPEGEILTSAQGLYAQIYGLRYWQEAWKRFTGMDTIGDFDHTYLKLRRVV